jgi:hypothetical protein
MSTSSVLIFLIGILVSTIIIYFTTRIFGEKEGIKHAILAATSGSIIYGVFYYFISNNIIASLIGALVWIFVLKKIYKMGWIKVIIIAFIIWILASILSTVIPTSFGPL